MCRLDKWQYGIRESPDAQVVVLSQVLAHPSNVGYEHLSNHLVSRMNDEPVVSLKHLMQLIEANKEKTLRFTLEPHDESVVLDAATLKDVTAELLHTHSIPADRSADLVDAPPHGGPSASGATNGKASAARRPKRT